MTTGDFHVVLTSPGPRKIAVIKIVRNATKLGLKESKDLVDGAPSVVMRQLGVDTARTLVDELAKVGAIAEVGSDEPASDAAAVSTDGAIRTPSENSSGAPEDSEHITKWDYKTVVLHGGFLGRHKEELSRRDLERQFDELGREGWELGWILMEQALQGEKDGHVVIFKRPIVS